MGSTLVHQHSSFELESDYGPVTISERVLQRIWLEQSFETQHLRTYSRKPVRVLFPGQWNMHEGPDFLGAKFTVDGELVQGDVEVHFQAKDWSAHGHAEDPNFQKVRLHVLLYEPTEEAFWQLTESGAYVVSLLDILSQDLEQYASDQALRSLEAKDYTNLLEGILLQPKFDRLALLKQKAHTRWQQKCRFIKQRVEKDGWNETLHQLALEVLGYRRNRQTMSQLSLDFPLERLESQVGQHTAKSLFERYEDQWKLNGLRPANHPSKRLEQYLEVVYKTRQWPRVFKHMAFGYLNQEGESIFEDSSTDAYRKTIRIGHLQDLISRYVFQGEITAGKFQTLFIDALLPALSVARGEDLFLLWYHWHPGDAPDSLLHFLRQTTLLSPPSQPNCNGLQQGALQIFFEGGLSS